MWELDHKEGWTLKNYVFELWCWRRLLRVHWTARRSNQSILKGINPEYSLAGLILKLSLQFFDQLMQRAYSLENTWIMEKLRAGGEGDNRGWDGWMALPTQWTWIWVTSGRWWRTGQPGELQSMGLQRIGHNLATEQQQHYTSPWLWFLQTLRVCL